MVTTLRLLVGNIIDLSFSNGSHPK
uniref:Uncharacterized protein n=1 Tax=Arundo donax TaxID=35708 RepID=A0A0A9BSC1_ARUDO